MSFTGSFAAELNLRLNVLVLRKTTFADPYIKAPELELKA